MKKIEWVLLLLLFLSKALGAGSQPPVIQTLLKPAVYQEVLKERGVKAYASLDGNKYSFYASMLVHRSLKVTRAVLTNYKLYSEMVPYIDRTEYSEKTHVLEIQGGIWNFKLVSSVLFQEQGEKWIHFKIIKGHFLGLSGNLYFENLGEKGTLVYMDGFILGEKWPPRFIMERGAEIVFQFTGTKMRSYIESKR